MDIQLGYSALFLVGILTCISFCMQVVIAGNHDLSFDAEASAVGTPYRHIIEHPELEKVGIY